MRAILESLNPGQHVKMTWGTIERDMYVRQAFNVWTLDGKRYRQLAIRDAITVSESARNRSRS